jgi:hypothetical protein
MLYLPNYAVALRCIGQALQRQNIEVFELQSDGDDFRVQGANPNPPYIGLIEPAFRLMTLKFLTVKARHSVVNRSPSFDSTDLLLPLMCSRSTYRSFPRVRRCCKQAPNGRT